MRKRGIKFYLAMGVLSTALGAIASSAVAQAPTKDSQVRRILSATTDGDERVYVVRCRNGTSGSVVASLASRSICATPSSGKTRCDKKWTLNDASQFSCQAVAK